MLLLYAPISNYNEAEKFLSIGVRNFFGGIVIGSIDKKLNCRPNTKEYNFFCIEELEKTINYIHKNDGKFNLTVNRWNISNEDFDLLYSKIKFLNIDSLIVYSYDLLSYLNDIKCDIPINISTLSGLVNFK